MALGKIWQFRSKKKTPTRKRKAKYPLHRNTLMPASQVVTMRYADAVTFDAGVGTTAYNSWNAMGCYDPYIAVGGHSPMGFDNFMAFYEHFTVLSSKMNCWVQTEGLTAADGVTLVTQVSDDVAAPGTTINAVIEQNKASYKYLTNGQGSMSTGCTNTYYNAKKFHGVTDVNDNEGLRGTSTADPTGATAVFHVAVGGFSPSDNPDIVRCRVLIEYKVLLTTLKDLAQS